MCKSFISWSLFVEETERDRLSVAPRLASPRLRVVVVVVLEGWVVATRYSSSVCSFSHIEGNV